MGSQTFNVITIGIILYGCVTFAEMLSSEEENSHGGFSITTTPSNFLKEVLYISWGTIMYNIPDVGEINTHP
jgi:hypothetical protein